MHDCDTLVSHFILILFSNLRATYSIHVLFINTSTLGMLNISTKLTGLIEESFNLCSMFCTCFSLTLSISLAIFSLVHFTKCQNNTRPFCSRLAKPSLSLPPNILLNFGEQKERSLDGSFPSPCQCMFQEIGARQIGLDGRFVVLYLKNIYEQTNSSKLKNYFKWIIFAIYVRLKEKRKNE